jgi:predicted DNA binding CopG/RHH family protein
MKKPLRLPKFKNEDEERDFWNKTDLGDYLEASDFERVYFPNLRPTTKTISIRLPEIMLLELKTRANYIDIPYQALIKKYIADGLARDNAVLRERPKQYYNTGKARKRKTK